MPASGYPWYWRARKALPEVVRLSARRGVDGVLAPFVGSVNRSDVPGRACLTLDDGPDPDITPAVLDVLAEHGARCTFFLLADRAVTYPAIARSIVDGGHEVALHGKDHRTVSTMPAGTARAYLREAKATLEQVTQVPVALFRPPYGSQSIASYRAARQSGLDVVVWNTDADDWVDRPRGQIVTDAVSGLTPGGILLFHERLEPHPVRGAPETTFDRAAAVGEIVTGMRSRGLEPSTVGGIGNLRRTAWFRP